MSTERLRSPAGLPSHGTAAAAAGLFAGFAGFGAGAVNLAIASSLLLSPAGGGLSVVAGTAAALWGSALLLWTALGLHRGHQPWAKPAMALLLTAAAVHGVSALAGTTTGLAVSQLAALLLTLMIVGAGGWLRRRSLDRPADGVAAGSAVSHDEAATPRVGRLLGIAFAGAVLVAGVATPGLAASTAGQFAVPHGEHGIPDSGSHHGH